VPYRKTTPKRFATKTPPGVLAYFLTGDDSDFLERFFLSDEELRKLWGSAKATILREWTSSILAADGLVVARPAGADGWRC
jgi:hypothetical protein